jgi:hypothetical protein
MDATVGHALVQVIPVPTSEHSHPCAPFCNPCVVQGGADSLGVERPRQQAGVEIKGGRSVQGAVDLQLDLQSNHFVTSDPQMDSEENYL